MVWGSKPHWQGLWAAYPATPGMLAQCRELWSRNLAHGLFSPSVWLTS